MASIVPFFIENETITLTKDGVWMSDGTEITHEETCKLFFRSIHREPASNNAPMQYFLKVGPEKKDIVVEDTPFFVKRLEGTAAEGFKLLLSDGSVEALAPRTLSYTAGRLICSVQNGEERARFLRAPYIELLMSAEENATEYFLTIAGQKVILEKKSL